MLSKKLFIIGILLALAVAGYFVYSVLATSNPHDWSTGLVGYWSFDGQYVSGTSVTDQSVNSNTGTLTNGVVATGGISGQALSFDGMNDYVSVGDDNSLDMTEAITIEAWVRADTLAGYDVIIGKTTDTTWADSFIMFTYSNGIRFSINGWNTNFAYVAFNYTTSLDTWYHIVATYDKENIIVYKNGIPGTPTAYTTAITTNNATLEIGRGKGNTWNWDGEIDEVRIYNRALSADEVAQHYKQTRRNVEITQFFGEAPIGWWKLDESPAIHGSTINNYITSGNSGILITNDGVTDKSVVGKIGNAIDFDGSDDYISIADTPNLDFGTGNFTVEAWVQVGAWQVSEGLISKKGGRLYRTDAGWAIAKTYTGDYTGPIYVGIADGTTNVNASSNLILTTALNHLAVVFDRTNGIAIPYLNGIAGNNMDISSVTGSVNNGASLRFSESGVDTWNGNNGMIDNVQIYNYIRTSAEIKQDYLLQSPKLQITTDNPHDWSTGLVGFWSFNGPYVSGTSVTDESVNSNTGTLRNGIQPTFGINGQAYDFDGVNDYISVLRHASLEPTSLTVEVWFKYNKAGTDVTVLDKHLGYWVRKFSNDYIYFFIWDGAAWRGTNAFPITVNTWYHFVATYQGTTVIVYRNGKFYNTFGTTNPISYGSQPLYIGGYTTANYWPGVIDEVRIYNRVLSAQEIYEHYLLTQNRFQI